MARFAAGLAALLLALAGCSGTNAGGRGGPEVVAAFYPLAEAARVIGGSEASVHDLTPAGVEPHDLELKPSDLSLLRSADLVLFVGGGFQPALEDAIGTVDGAKAVDLLDGLSLIKAADGDHENDPHVWLDPILMARIVDRVATEMIAKRPSHRLPFEAAAKRYVQALEELDRDFEDTLATCRRREIVTAHSAFGYLAARYGLEQIPVAISPEVEPTPRQLQDVTRLARSHGATTIFFEPLAGSRVVETVARAVGAETAVLNPVEGLTDEQQRSGENYLSLMKGNLAALAEGLDCTLT